VTFLLVNYEAIERDAMQDRGAQSVQIEKLNVFAETDSCQVRAITALQPRDIRSAIRRLSTGFSTAMDFRAAKSPTVQVRARACDATRTPHGFNVSAALPALRQMQLCRPQRWIWPGRVASNSVLRAVVTDLGPRRQQQSWQGMAGIRIRLGRVS